jgi:hypothetical protein
LRPGCRWLVMGCLTGPVKNLLAHRVGFRGVHRRRFDLP